MMQRGVRKSTKNLQSKSAPSKRKKTGLHRLLTAEGWKRLMMGKSKK